MESTEQEVEVEDEQKQYHSGKEASWEKAGTSHSMVACHLQPFLYILFKPHLCVTHVLYVPTTKT